MSILILFLAIIAWIVIGFFALAFGTLHIDNEDLTYSMVGEYFLMVFFGPIAWVVVLIAYFGKKLHDNDGVIFKYKGKKE